MAYSAQRALAFRMVARYGTAVTFRRESITDDPETRQAV